MFYSRVKKTSNPERTARKLLALKDALAAQVPSKCDDKVLLATWNIREFDSLAYGDRSLECLYYIAEILSHFDLIAVQEVREDINALDDVVNILGKSNWDYIVSDVTEGKPGNRERMAFVYNKKSVSFNRVAGEIVIPPKRVKTAAGDKVYEPANQLYRTPYMCGFRVGWSYLLLSTVHIIYGKDTANNPDRVEEIETVAEFLAKRSRERQDYDRNNLVLLGDFNIFSHGDVTMEAIERAGFEVPEELQHVPPTNVGKKPRHYDQIAFKSKPKRFETTGQAGVFDFFNVVYTNDDEAIYAQAMGPAYLKTSKGKIRDAKAKTSYYRTYWRTHQMSDHLPMWIQLKTNFAKDYLNDIVAESTTP
ncbi:Endonuclease/Exonuclease/phosphatase family protein [Shimia gijangensis]|uniref:Endonuclease/Exonuclease/phosphatase family protein n=1 Tax=Shimia gijangensis TaxID=1470563 RepID=A0A1M6S8U4_9RHOB|nr:endonuclease/exonuclease/phosphatase family protein [Shimia gijangensis]SHK40947.1 Endonuclease/Exonuclease/phosphatase family protein [Shimia gijangensis]